MLENVIENTFEISSIALIGQWVKWLYIDDYDFRYSISLFPVDI